MLRLHAAHPRHREGQGASIPRRCAHGRGDDRLKPAPFEYAAPESLDEALELLARYGEDAKAIAGGQSLGPLLNLRLATPAVLVDLNRIGGLDGVAATDGALELGALVRQRVLERAAEVAAACPLLAEAAPWIGHVAIRNRGTIGGSLAHADPAAELPAIALALEAEIEAASVRGQRSIAAADLFVTALTTSLAPDEVIVAVRLPRASGREGHAWLELAERHGDFALAGAAALVMLDAGGRCDRVRLALAGVGSVPVDASRAVSFLEGERPEPAALREAAEHASDSCEPVSDAHASAGYRRRIARVLGERALALAAERAARGPA